MSGAPFLSLNNISKQFGGVKALNQVSLSISKGEILALIGENGAGKSTLMKILGGIHQPTEGEIKLDGQSCKILDAKDAEKKGVSFVHQELNLLDNLDLASNIFLGREERTWGWIHKKKLIKKAKPILKSLGLNIDPTIPLSNLSNAQQQLVEIAKALSMNSKLLILDEPTSSLSSFETDHLLNLLLKLKQQGLAIIYISHRLSEVEKIADRVCGLRDGEMVGELKKSDITHSAMVSLMIGRELNEVYPTLPTPSTEVMLKVENVMTKRWPTGRASLRVHRKEIVGIYGLVGAGRSELVEAIFGVETALGGKVWLNGKSIQLGQVKESIGRGLYLAPEDRKKSSLLLDMSIRENMSLNSLKSMSSWCRVDKKREKRICQTWLLEYGVKAESIEVTPRTLSGGNQQKVVLSKWMTQNPEVMIFDEPTRGIDIGSRKEIYENMSSLAKQGCGVLMVSSDMEELLGMCHRIVVMRDGNTLGDIRRSDFSEAALMNMMMRDVQVEV